MINRTHSRYIKLAVSLPPAFGCALLFLCMNGCAGYGLGGRYSPGVPKFQFELVEQIEPGKTTHAEVMRLLGRDLLDTFLQGYVRTPKGSVAIVYIGASPSGTSHSYVWLIAVEGDEIVDGMKGFFKAEPKKTFRGICYSWNSATVTVCYSPETVKRVFLVDWPKATDTSEVDIVYYPREQRIVGKSAAGDRKKVLPVPGKNDGWEKE